MEAKSPHGQDSQLPFLRVFGLWRVFIVEVSRVMSKREKSQIHFRSFSSSFSSSHKENTKIPMSKRNGKKFDNTIQKGYLEDSSKFTFIPASSAAFEIASLGALLASNCA
jgi:hypothetical protein